MRLLIFIATSLLFIQFAHAKNYKTLKTEIEQTYGIEIEFDNIEFPSRWNENFSPNVSSVDVSLRKKTLLNLKYDLSLYRISLLKKFLKKIFITDKLTFRGILYGGTNHVKSRWVYVDYSLLGKGRTTFHHEFSSLLVILNKFPVDEWQGLNPVEYVYPMEGESIAILIEGNTNMSGNPTTYKSGFVAGYGMMNLENDLNTYFELLIGNPVRLAKLENKYPPVRKKAELLREFYYGIVNSSK